MQEVLLGRGPMVLGASLLEASDKGCQGLSTLHFTSKDSKVRLCGNMARRHPEAVVLLRGSTWMGNHLWSSSDLRC